MPGAAEKGRATSGPAPSASEKSRGAIAPGALGTAIIEPPALEPDATRIASQAIALSRSLETIQSAFDAWDELRAAQARALQRLADERRRLEEEGELLVGAVRSVADGLPPPPPSAPVPDALVAAADSSAVDHFLTEARRQLDDAKARLDAEERATAEAFARATIEVKATARSRLEARLRVAPPRVRLVPRTVGADQRILHLERPGPDDAVVLFLAFTGRIPSRYGAPFDDSTDDVFTGPTTLYPDEGVPADEARPSAMRLRLLLDAQPEVWPLKGYLLLDLVAPDGTRRFVRWLSRGPVMEAELEDGPTFRNVLSREEAEQITGALLRLKLAGRLEIDLGRA
ncbi:MAG: hypothetical protein AB1938_00245 [Myxococcota bacterium]